MIEEESMAGNAHCDISGGADADWLCNCLGCGYWSGFRGSSDASKVTFLKAAQGSGESWISNVIA